MGKLMMVKMLVYMTGCEYNSIPTTVSCSTSDLAIVVTAHSNPTSCNSNDGSIVVQGSGGKSPYHFAINTGAYSTALMFNNLNAGIYIVTVKDANNCERTVQITLTSAESSLTATAITTSNTGCISTNGSLTVNATGGILPYQYQLGSSLFGAIYTFTNLKDGNYAIVVKDGVGCTVTLGVTVARGNTGVSYSNQIVPIINSSCISCHGSGSQNGDWTKYTNVKAHSALIKTYTANGTMPVNGSLTTEQIALIGCWVNDGAFNN
ncbi:MAG: hypothetical protein JST37_01055 [Bacteroidetes bacterium]|jgi:hypothetical protein|nr:hypothetical protein [Bacteroidota bacterium]